MFNDESAKNDESGNPEGGLAVAEMEVRGLCSWIKK